jgi:hypothetical protein
VALKRKTETTNPTGSGDQALENFRSALSGQQQAHEGFTPTVKPPLNGMTDRLAQHVLSWEMGNRQGVAENQWNEEHPRDPLQDVLSGIAKLMSKTAAAAPPANGPWNGPQGRAVGVPESESARSLRLWGTPEYPEAKAERAEEASANSRPLRRIVAPPVAGGRRAV